MADETDVQTELAAARARIAELNQESAGHRHNAKTVREEYEAAKAKHAEDLRQYGEKLTNAEKAAQAAADRKTQALRDAALRLAAKDAGMVDLDGLKLLDLSAVKVGDDDDVAIPDSFFTKAKEAKPWLFAQTGAQTGTTASSAKAPKASAPSAKSARDMDDAEYAALKATLTRRR